MQMPAKLRDDIIALLPDLRAFSGSLAGDPSLADDLVQETLVKVWSRFETFQRGTNLRAWLFTILRNEFYSHHRRRRREVLDGEGHVIDHAATEASQPGHMELEDVGRSLARLSDEQREAIVLFAAAGFSYEEVGQICGCAMGTVKSRINRARRRICRMLANGPEEGARARELPDGMPGRVQRHGQSPRRGPQNGACAGAEPRQGRGRYRRPEEICRAAELDWVEKLHLLNGWRQKVCRDMETGTFDQAGGNALLGELNLALRQMAGTVFPDAKPGM